MTEKKFFEEKVNRELERERQRGETEKKERYRDKR